MLGKGGKERIVPLDEALLEAIDGERDWLLGCRVRPDWLSNKQRPVWQALGLPDEFHLYMGRHWYATTLLRRGATIRQVQVLLVAVPRCAPLRATRRSRLRSCHGQSVCSPRCDRPVPTLRPGREAVGPWPVRSADVLCGTVVFLGDAGGQSTDVPDALVELAGLTPRRHLDGVPQLGDIWDGYRLVHDAVLDFGAGLTAEQISRDQAAGILRLTAIWERLSERERAAVLRRFPQHIDSRDLQDS